MNEFERSLIEIPSLPTVPAIAQRLLELVDDESSGLEELAEVIALDPALSAKIVRVINSSMYAMSREITSVREAALYLGTCNVCSIALSFSFVSSFGGPRRDGEMERLWHTSLMTSLVARRLALEVGGWDSEEAFLIGLLCDCGALLMYAELPEYGELVKRFYRGELDLLEAERTAFPSDHTRIGALLLERWAFPQRYCSLIAHHHDPSSDVDPKIMMRQRILNSAWLCSRALTIPGYASQTAALSQQLVDTFDIPRSVADTILEELPSELRSIASSLDIAVNEQRSYHELLSDANTELVDLALGQHRTMRALAGTVGGRSGFDDVLEVMEQSIVHDRATGLMNRASFEPLLDAIHERSKQRKIPLGLLIIDCEPRLDSKESPAHPPDEILARTAKHLSGVLRSGDPLARLGARQIAVLVPGCEGEDLKHLAARVRNALAATEDSSGSAPDDKRFRFSLGIAESQPHYPDCDAQQLIVDAFSDLERAN